MPSQQQPTRSTANGAMFSYPTQWGVVSIYGPTGEHGLEAIVQVCQQFRGLSMGSNNNYQTESEGSDTPATSTPAAAKNTPAAKRQKRTMSAAARAKIGAATRARHAAQNAQKRSHHKQAGAANS